MLNQFLTRVIVEPKPVRLYHPFRAYILLALLLLLVGCSAPRLSQGEITVSIQVDSQNIQVKVPAGSTASEALAVAGVSLNDLDRSDPPLYTLLSDGSKVRVIRIKEEFYVEQVVIPYEHQEVRNESLPAGETRLSQNGVNGMQENTYRRVDEDGVEVSNSIVRTVVVKQPVPEIIMVGSQTPFTSLAIPGRIAYLSSGNAWVMEGSTGNRRAVVTTGDLDGQIFSLSPDGTWLLFTRYGKDQNPINTLWAAKVDDDSGLMLDLKISNVVHFAEWAPWQNLIAYSTVEPRSTAPGWQANNDLLMISVSSGGFLSEPRVKLEANSGGVYGWWGMDFRWAYDGIRLVFARSDSVGIYDTSRDAMTTLVDITPFQTGGDWAWVPGIAWGPDDKVIYTVDHVAPAGSASSEQSPHFDLLAIPLSEGAPVHLVSDVGMFAYPSPSPVQQQVTFTDTTGLTQTEKVYQVAYLQAVFPTQSDTSAYRLTVMDRDGSNHRQLFPEAGAPGLKPQRVVWSPAGMNDQGSYAIAFIYEGNIWIVNAADGQAQQITGNGLTVRIDWK